MTDYYAAREAQELRIEAYAGTRDTSSEEAQGFFAGTGPARGDRSAPRGERPVTLRSWLEQTAAHKPSPGELREVHRPLVLDAQARLDAAVAALAEAVTIRDLELADANEDGWTTRELGALVGMSHEMASRCIRRSRAGCPA